MLEKELQAAYKDKLTSSGLTLADAATLKFQINRDPSKLGIVPTFPGFAIPYFDESGKEVEHFRFRYLVDTRSQFERLAKAKGRRYSQPAKSGLAVYLPPIGAGEEWSETIADPAQPIVITEGELKAACACKLGFPTVGLGGVWAFIKDDVPLEFFTETVWEGRKVYICYDSDAATNVNVNKAEARLAHLIGEHGGLPHIIRLPTKDGAKVGLDDYLLDRGPEDFEQLITKAEPYQEVEVLHRLNEELLVILNPSMIVQRDSGYLMSRRTLCDVNYADRTHYEETVSKKGDVKRKKIKTAEAWIEWPGRATAQKVTFEPGKPEFTSGGYNAWKGWAVQPDSKAGVRPWKEMLDYAFQDADPAHRRWFEQWAAYPLQHPGEKLATCVVMFGVVEGTGKTFMGLSLKEIYGQHGILLGEEALGDDRNEWAKNMQFVVGDEIAGNDKRGVADRLRAMITRRELRLNPKYVPSYTIPDCINYYFTSNRPDAFQLSGTDRRNFVHEMGNSPLPHKFYVEYEDWLFHKGGAAALFAYMLELDLTGFQPQAPAPMTAAKEQMQVFGRSDIAQWVSEMLAHPDEALGVGAKDIYTTGELLMLYDPEGRKKITANGLGKVLKEHRIYQPNKGQPVPLGGTSKRVYIVRNVEKWMSRSLAEMDKHYRQGVKNERKY